MSLEDARNPLSSRIPWEGRSVPHRRRFSLVYRRLSRTVREEPFENHCRDYLVCTDASAVRWQTGPDSQRFDELGALESRTRSPNDSRERVFERTNELSFRFARRVDVYGIARIVPFSSFGDRRIHGRELGTERHVGPRRTHGQFARQRCSLSVREHLDRECSRSDVSLRTLAAPKKLPPVTLVDRAYFPNSRTVVDRAIRFARVRVNESDRFVRA